MSATHPDAPVRTLLERIDAPAAAAQPDLEAIGAAVLDLAGDVDYLATWIERLGDTSGLVRIHVPERGPRLLLVHRLDGQMGAVHDHRVWVALAPISGVETHRRYARPTAIDALPRRTEETEVAAGGVVTLVPPDDVHDHGHLRGHGEPAYCLILTGDDQTRFERNEWDLATGRHRLLRPGEPGRWLAVEPMP